MKMENVEKCVTHASVESIRPHTMQLSTMTQLHLYECKLSERAFDYVLESISSSSSLIILAALLCESLFVCYVLYTVLVTDGTFQLRII